MREGEGSSDETGLAPLSRLAPYVEQDGATVGQDHPEVIRAADVFVPDARKLPAAVRPLAGTEPDGDAIGGATLTLKGEAGERGHSGHPE